MSKLLVDEISDADNTGPVTVTDGLTVQGAFTSLGIDDNATSTAMTLDASGNVLVGKTSNSFGTTGVALNPDGSNNMTRSGDPALALNRLSSDGAILGLYKDGTTVGSIGTAGGTLTIDGGGTSSGIYFGENQLVPRDNGAGSNNIVDLGQSGNSFKDLYLSGGVYLGGTGAANHLDDYEEGTWTPTLPNGGTVTPNGGYYVKIGASVTLTMQADFAPTNNGSIFKIGGIPFVNKTGASTYSVGSVGYSGVLNTSNWHGPLIENNGGSYIYFQRNDGTTAPIYNSAFSGGTYNLILAVTYFTDS